MLTLEVDCIFFFCALLDKNSELNGNNMNFIAAGDMKRMRAAGTKINQHTELNETEMTNQIHIHIC